MTILLAKQNVRQSNDEFYNREVMEKEARRKRLSPFLEINLQDKTQAKKNYFLAQPNFYKAVTNDYNDEMTGT